MSIILGFIGDLFIAMIFEFVMYITGSVVIRLVTFGMKSTSLLSFKEFRAEKQKTGRKYTFAVFTGLFFYIAIIVTIFVLG